MYRCFLDKVEKFGDYNNIYIFFQKMKQLIL